MTRVMTGAVIPAVVDDPGIDHVLRELTAAADDADRLVTGLSDAEGAHRAQPGAWSVAECLDHLAAFNAGVLRAMRVAADRARREGRVRRGPVGPDLSGRLLLRFLEPPAVFRVRTISAMAPTQRPLATATAAFRASHAEVRAFLLASRDLDLGVRFAMPFSRVLRLRLASGARVIAVHERRHLWQAWRAREAARETAPVPPATRHSA